MRCGDRWVNSGPLINNNNNNCYNNIITSDVIKLTKTLTALHTQNMIVNVEREVTKTH